MERAKLIAELDMGVVSATGVTRIPRDARGGDAVADEYRVIRYVMNLWTTNACEGTHDMHAMILGRAQTGPSAFGWFRAMHSVPDRMRQATTPLSAESVAQELCGVRQPSAGAAGDAT